MTKAAPRTGSTWGAVLMPAPPIKNDALPKEILLVLDHRSGSMYEPKMIAEGNPDELANALLNLFEAGPLKGEEGAGLPRAIVFQSPRPARQLRSALDELSIAVEVDSEQPGLMGMVAQMAEALEASLEAQGILDTSELDKPDGFGSWKEADTRLTEHLIKVAMAKHGPLKSRPLVQYFGDAARGRAFIEDEEDPTPGVAYFSWFVFRYRARRGALTVAEQVFTDGRLPALQLLLLEARIHARCIVGRVVEMDPGAWIDLENVLSGEVHRLHDLGLSRSAREGLGLMVEIYPADEWMFTMVAGPAMPSMAIDHALRRIEAIGHEFENGVLVGDRAHTGELFIHPPMNAPMLQNTDGEPMEMLTVSFALEPNEDIESVLCTVDGIEDDGDGTWTWLAPSNGKAGFENGVILAHFEQVGDELLASVNSIPRSLKVKDLLSHVPGVKFLSIHPTPEPENAPSPFAFPGAAPGAVPPEVQAQLEQLLHDRAMASLDESVPALGGKTYREAARSPELRADVERMIRTYPDAGTPNGPIRMPRQEMLRELGLE
ncbi:hypothetical protein Poly30_10700 [Planctomycetes bacterium Poly30]|uniref:DUF6930 domain-containing protein n=1 Tax=Saltatorellus ferox TaxID=2528018 RepID=A0A518ENA7_9BACT|nr:hypothetical protein Poly30_10700 [Planctomycetes bacterium Poly30]